MTKTHKWDMGWPLHFMFFNNCIIFPYTKWVFKSGFTFFLSVLIEKLKGVKNGKGSYLLLNPNIKYKGIQWEKRFHIIWLQLREKAHFWTFSFGQFSLFSSSYCIDILFKKLTHGNHFDAVIIVSLYISPYCNDIFFKKPKNSNFSENGPLHT